MQISHFNQALDPEAFANVWIRTRRGASAAAVISCAIGLMTIGGSATAGRAAVILPSGLSAGSQYQIAFITSTIALIDDGTDLSVYNSLVTNLAAANPDLPANVTWTAILGAPQRTVLVQTGVDPETGEPTFEFQTYPGVPRDANSPAYANVPIYNTLGERVVADGDAFYEARFGTSNRWENPIWGDESGQKVVPVSNFSNLIDGVLGWSQIGGQWFMNNAYEGMSSSTQFGADEIGFRSSPQISGRIRALSSPITVVPEPAACIMGVSGLAFGVFFACRRRKQA